MRYYWTFLTIFDKRDIFSFFILQMSHLLSNIPSAFFYRSIFSERFRIIRCTLGINDFTSRAYVFYPRMMAKVWKIEQHQLNS